MSVFVFSLFACAAFAQDTTTDPNAPQVPPADSLTGEALLKWGAYETVGTGSLIAGVVTAGLGTWADEPHEYGTHWTGFGKRYGMRLTGLATSNLLEGGLSALFGEDPRYRRDPNAHFRQRLRHVVKYTFLVVNRDGETQPAFARYFAISGSNFLSNTWRADSEANTPHAILRIGFGFIGHFMSNAWDEFWPDVKTRVFHVGP